VTYYYFTFLAQIIVGDCLAELDKLKNENVQFDFVFFDLTDIPLSIKPQNKEWQFLLDVMEKSLSVLKPNGQFLTHVMTFIICLDVYRQIIRFHFI
jgi:spermine synthase